MVRALAFALALVSASPANSFCWRARWHSAASPAPRFLPPAAHTANGYVRQRISLVEATSRKASVVIAAAPKQSKYDLKWEARFWELKTYKDEMGDCNVPQKEGQLGLWVYTQRMFFKRGKLSQERMERLESIDFTWNPLEAEWEARFDELKKYKDEMGDCNVPKTEGQLGEWVDTQRMSYKGRKLSQQRIDMLENIGFTWDPLEELWETNFKELVQYRKQHGDCNVPTRAGQLGMWVSSQRQFYKREKLSQDRILQLKSVGFQWELRDWGGSRPRDELWRTRYIDLVRYLMEHGDSNVPRKRAPLGNWVHTQRTRYKDGRLYQYRIDYLESIGFAWELKRGGRDVPDRPKPNLEAVARLIKKEQGTPVAQALEAYLDATK